MGMRTRVEVGTVVVGTEVVASRAAFLVPVLGAYIQLS